MYDIVERKKIATQVISIQKRMYWVAASSHAQDSRLERLSISREGSPNEQCAQSRNHDTSIPIRNINR